MMRPILFSEGSRPVHGTDGGDADRWAGLRAPADRTANPTARAGGVARRGQGFNLTREDGTSFLDIADRAGIRTVTEGFPLEQAGLALERLRTGALKGAAVLVPGEGQA